MSLHIESTENALAELKKQRTKTLTAAISVSFLGIALMGLLLYLVHIIVAVPEDPPMVAYATQEGDTRTSTHRKLPRPPSVPAVPPPPRR